MNSLENAMSEYWRVYPSLMRNVKVDGCFDDDRLTHRWQLLFRTVYEETLRTRCKCQYIVLLWTAMYI